MVCIRPLGVGGGVWSGSWVDDVFSVEGAEVGSVLMWIELAAVSAALFNATAVGMNSRGNGYRTDDGCDGVLEPSFIFC